MVVILHRLCCCRSFRRSYPQFVQTIKLTTTSCPALKSTYFITSPIFYVNAAPHLGHLYSAVIVDASHRFRIMLGASHTIFCTGTDEHGFKIQQAAAVKGESIRFFCDSISSKFQELFDLANIEYTSFGRTTQDSHIRAVQHFWRLLEASGNIYKGKYEGWYCTSEESFLRDLQIQEKRGIDGVIKKVSIESGHPVEWTEENNYMFSLSKFKDDLMHWLKSGNVVTPRKFLDILQQMIDENLVDISVSRSRERLEWGIPVPGDNTQIIYVWLDALVYYLTAAGYPNDNFLWPPDVQVIGKDILKFHGIYWPAFLMAAGLEPPRSIFCHSHWTVDGEKMSKSKGNVIDPMVKIQASSSDAVRYFLLREGVPHSDGNYSAVKFVNLVNAELGDTLGNLLSRSTAPSLNKSQIFPRYDKGASGEMSREQSAKLVSMVVALPNAVKEHYSEFNFYKGLELIMAVLRLANAFVQESEPWSLAKDPSKEVVLQNVLHLVIETLRVVGILLLPITPVLANRMLDRLGIRSSERGWRDLKPFQNVTGISKNVYEGRPLGIDCDILFKKVKVDDIR